MKKVTRKKAAAKKSAIKRKKKTAKAAGKAPARKGGVSAATIAALEKRVLALEKALAALEDRRARAGLRTASTKTLKFTKDSDSPAWTRLTVEGTEVIGPYESSGQYRAPASVTLSAFMEINGSTGDKATVSITNAKTSSIILEMPDDRGQTSATYTIWVED